MCKCHIRQNQYAEWIFFSFRLLVFPCSPVLWIILDGRLDCLGAAERASSRLGPSGGKMFTRVNISPYFTKGFGLCLLGKELSAWVANPQGRRWITRQESPGCVLAKGRNSASLPLQWASQQTLAWLCPPWVLSVPLCSSASLTQLKNSKVSRRIRNLLAGKTEGVFPG